MTGRDGIDQPAHTPSISTPKGRGRRTAADRAMATRLVAWTEMIATIMCR